MMRDVTAKYAPALLTAPLGAFDPVYAAVAFGMVTGWLAIAGVMYEQRKSLQEIKRALVVSLLIGGGGALFAIFAVSRLHLNPLDAAIAAFVIAFSGVRTIKLFTSMVSNAFNWIIGSLIDDAARRARKHKTAIRSQMEANKATRTGLETKGE